MYSDTHKQYFPMLTQRGEPYHLFLYDRQHRQGVIKFHTHCDVTLIEYAVQHSNFVRETKAREDFEDKKENETKPPEDGNDYVPRTRDLTAIPSSTDFQEVVAQTCNLRKPAVSLLLSSHGVTVYAPNLALAQYLVDIVDAPDNLLPNFLNRIMPMIAQEHSWLLGACLRTPDSTHPSLLPMFIRNTTSFLELSANEVQPLGFDVVFIPFEEKDPHAKEMFSEMKAQSRRDD